MNIISSAQAQVPEAIHAASQAGDQIMALGPIGALFVLVVLALIGAAIVLWKAFRSEGNARITEMRSVVKETTEAMSNTSKSVTALSVAGENTNRLNEQRLDALRSMNEQQAALLKLVERLDVKLDRIIDRREARP